MSLTSAYCFATNRSVLHSVVCLLQCSRLLLAAGTAAGCITRPLRAYAASRFAAGWLVPPTMTPPQLPCAGCGVLHFCQWFQRFDRGVAVLRVLNSVCGS